VFVTQPSARAARNQLAMGFDWDRSSLDDAVEVLDALEPLVQRDAASHRTKADAAAARKLLEKMALSTDDREAYVRLSMSLRRRVAKVSSNAPLHSLYVTVVDFLEASAGDLAAGGFDVEADLASAQALVQAVAKGDGGRPLRLAHSRPAAAA
jgi:DNA-binding FadR family transcriptional regulator